MIAIDTSSMIAYLQGDKGRDIEKVDFALHHHQAILPPVVLSELLSDPKLDEEVVQFFRELPIMTLSYDFWEKTGRLRSQLLKKKLKGRLADTLIAQNCIDHNIPLISRDRDFSHFAKIGGLKLL